MHTSPARAGLNHFLLIVAVLGGPLTTATVAGERGQIPRADNGQTLSASTRPGAPAKPVEKTWSFEFRDKPWGAVLEWLANQTGLSLGSTYRPKGAFTFIPPRGKKRTLA